MSDLKAVAAEDREPEGTEPNEIGDALARALVELRAIGRDLLELANVGLDKAKLGVRAGAFRLLILTWLGLTAAAATIVAAYFVVDGLSRGMGELFGGQIWAGRLVGGSLILLLIGAVALVARARSRRANLERLKKKYQEAPR